VVWTNRAKSDLLLIVEYIELFNPNAAVRLAGRLAMVAESLAEFPQRGRPISDNLREITTLSPYIIRYRILSDIVEIIRVRHSARLPDET
jgi:toxin ParE1/3/4